jgi:sialidase-1
MLVLLVCALACALSSAVVGAEPLLEKVDVFEAGAGGYALYRIPAIAVTAKGTVLAACEARLTGKSDWDAIDIVLRRSTDGGKTWSERLKLPGVPGEHSKNPILGKRYADSAGLTYNNPVLIADRGGLVHALFCLEYMRCFYLRSSDDGVTWSKPVEITSAFEEMRKQYDWKVIATGPGHGIEVRSGRLIVPVWLSTGTGGGAHRPSIAATVFSDDGGTTWQAGEIAVPNTDEWINPNETTLVELADGRVMLNVRSESSVNRRLVTTSKDGATGWTAPRFDDALREPICMASMVRMTSAPPSNKSRIVFSNPDNLERADGKAAPGKGRDRKNLSIKLSYDEAQSWPVSKVLEPGPSGYSDLAVLPDGTVLCFYERSTTDGKLNNKFAALTVARFNLEWLTEGKDRLSP